MTYRTISEQEAQEIFSNEDAEYLPFQAVNEAGIEEIRGFLAEYHRLGEDHFTAEMLNAWASDAEFQLGEGNSASVEIKSWDSLTGRTETFTISAAGVEWQVCE